MKAISVATTLFIATCVSAQDLPQPSPSGEVEQVVGLTKVEVEYSRPSVKGRVIFGELVKYDELWRTGANLNTTIEFSSEVKFGDQDLKPGKYSLFTVPGKTTWVVKLNKNTELWGEGDFKEEETVVALKVEAQPTEFTETMTFEFANVVGDNADLVLRWEKTKVVILARPMPPPKGSPTSRRR
ncbi:MAG: DUF2911 domain-containing protein [Flavobacteriales bacterium]|nr:DUF2911 domain-containing protein [Flavobacteriales bacterium]